MNRALVFGGAFNPPTNAHIALANFAREMIGYEKVVFVPSKMNYITDDQKKDFAFSDSQRYEMLCAIAYDHPWMDVSAYEIQLKNQPRTYETMVYLSGFYDHIQLLFGSDKLEELETGWKHVDEIMNQFGVVCMQRSFDDCHTLIQTHPYLKQYQKYVTCIQTPDTYQSISSTQVRKLYKQKEYTKLQHYIPIQIQQLLENDYEKYND